MTDITMFELHIHDGVAFENHMPWSSASRDGTESTGSDVALDEENRSGSVASGFGPGGPPPRKIVAACIACILVITAVAIAIKHKVRKGDEDELADAL